MYRDFDLTTLEQQYSPSSCIDDIAVYLNQYRIQSDKQKQRAKQSNTVLENLSYGGSAKESLDLFFPHPDVQAQHKLMVYIHGGYWQELSKDASCFAAQNFQQHGFHFAALGYDLAPNVKLHDIVEQNRRAISWLYNNAREYGYRHDEIYLSGSSAGAHLVTQMALTNWHDDYNIETQFIKGICAVSGIYDLTPIQFTYINDALQLSQQEITLYSPLITPEHLARLSNCQSIIAYGDNETDEFKRQSIEFYQAIKSHNTVNQCAEIAGKNHFDVILDLADSNSWLFKQILKQMQ